MKAYLRIELPATKETAYTGKTLVFYEPPFSDTPTQLEAMERAVERYDGRPESLV